MDTQRLLPGFVWLPDKDSGRKAYLLKLDKEIKSNFNYVENTLNKQRGYRRDQFIKGSSLALYISRYFGDGIYSSEAPEILELFTGASETVHDGSGGVYFLVVSGGKVLAGTDIIVNREFYNFFHEQIASTEYSDLNMRWLTTEDLFELNRKFINDTVSEGKQSKVLLGFVLIFSLFLFAIGLAWFILMA